MHSHGNGIGMCKIDGEPSDIEYSESESTSPNFMGMVFEYEERGIETSPKHNYNNISIFEDPFTPRILKRQIVRILRVSKMMKKYCFQNPI